MRPAGDPIVLAGVGRGMAAAADELERLGRQAAAAARALVIGGGWSGPASRAYLTRDGALEARVRIAAGALRSTGEGLATLSGALAVAQATWDRAGALAASAGLTLDPAAPPGPFAPPLAATDPRATVAARVSELLHEAGEQAGAADRAAAAGFSGAARTAVLARLDGDAPGGGPRRRREEGSALLARVLGLADRVGVALGAGLGAIEARAEALQRLVRGGGEPGASLGAARAIAAFERSAVPPAAVAVLPVGGPALTMFASLVEGERSGEPVLRTLVRSLGQSLGADVGQRLGMATCGVDAVATSGAGVVLCPAITVAAGSIGAGLGGAAAVRIYDALQPRSQQPSPAAPPGSTGGTPSAGSRSERGERRAAMGPASAPAGWGGPR
jgi:hypothetical protein